MKNGKLIFCLVISCFLYNATKVNGQIFPCGAGGLTDYIPVFTNASGTTACNSVILQKTSNISIGYTSGPTNSKLDVDGDINLSRTVGTCKLKFNGTTGLHLSGTQNTFLGVTTGTGASTGRDNTLIGANLGLSFNVSSADYNSIVGSSAGGAMTSGDYNVIMGYNAASSLTTNSTNIIIGGNAAAGYNNSSGTLIGYQVAANNSGSNNTAVGYQAFNQASATTGSHNTMIGLQAGTGAGNGSSNVYIGELTGAADDGSNNVFIGASTGYNNAGGIICSTSVLVGQNLRIAGGAHNNVTAIGSGARPNCSDCVTLGDVGATNDDRILMGYASSPTSGTNWHASRLYVNVVSGETSAAWFNGDVYASGTFTGSDSKLKSNIKALPEGSAMSILDALNPQTYTFKRESMPQLNLPSGNQCGFLAEDVEKVLPQLVKEFTTPPLKDEAGNIINPELTYKAVNYTGLIPYLVQIVKEQKQQLTALTSQVAEMQSQINNCCGTGNRQPDLDNLNGSSIDVDLKNTKSIILNQNVPNPFAEQTTIPYSIPSDVKQAQIFFYDNHGTILRTIDITERGAGQLNVFAADLSSGAYTYTLVADGKLIETKKMVKQ